MDRDRTDNALMMKVRDGCLDSFQVLIERHQQGVVNFFSRLVASRQTAEDYSQEIFLRVFRNRHRYTPRAKFTTFLYRVARNYWVDCQRKQSREPQVLSLDAEFGDEGDGNLRLIDIVPAPEVEAVPETSPVRRELLRRALDALPEGHRVVFILAEENGMRYADIAESLDLPVGTVKSRVHNAVRKLRRYLEQHEGDTTDGM